MANLNSLSIIGHCGRDAENRFMPNGDPVASVSVAVTEKYKDKEETTWFDCSFFGKLADVAGKYLQKGSLVFLQGHVTLNVYQKKDGTQGASLRVTVREMKMLGSGGRSDSTKQHPASAAPQGHGATRTDPKTGSSFDDLESDIPL